MRPDRKDAQAGFALGPILYLLALIGIGAGILFSGYSQILRSNVNITQDMETKNDLNGSATTLSATSVLGNTDNTILCPPQGGNATANCSAAPVRMEPFATVAASPDSSKLPTNYANAGTTNPATGFETGVFAPGAGVKQLDPYGHFYIYCRRENAVSDGVTSSIMIISAGPDGTLNTTCNDTTAQGDDEIISWTAPTAVNRSAIWQTTSGVNGTQAQFGEVGHQLMVDALGNITVPGALTVTGTSNFGGSGTFAGAVTAPNFVGSVSGTTGVFSGAVSAGGGFLGDLTGNVNGGTISGSTGAFSSDVSVGGALGVTGAATLSGTLGVTGKTTLSNALDVTSTVTVGVINGQQVFISPLGSITANSGFVGNLAGDVVGDVTGNLTGNVNGAITGPTGTFASAMTVGGASNVDILANGNANFAGTVTAASFSGNATTATTATNVTGVVGLANGGTGMAATSNNNLLNGLGVLNSSYYLNMGLVANQSITDAMLSNTGVVAGSYNQVTVNAEGRVTGGSVIPSTSDNITDGSGDSVTANGGDITFLTNGGGNDVIDSNGNLGLGTSTPQTKLDVEGNIRIDGSSGTSRELEFTTSNSERWIISTNSQTEGGGNAGSNFAITGYDDSGNVIGNALTIARASLAATFTGSVSTPFLSAGAAALSGTLTASNVDGGAALFTGTVTAANISGGSGYFSGTVTAASFSGNITGTISLADGSAGAPGLFFTNEINTGLYRAGTGRFGFAVEGGESLELDTVSGATDYVTITPAASGGAPVIASAGDANAGLALVSAGNGDITLTPGSSGAVAVPSGAVVIGAGGAVSGYQLSATGGVYSAQASATAAAVAAVNSTTSGAVASGEGAGLFASATGAGNTADALFATNSSSSGYAGYFAGAVDVTGNLSAGSAAIAGTTTVGNLTITGSCTGCVAASSTIYLGSLTTANPQIAGEVNSGFSSAGAHLVDVGISGSRIAEWSTAGESLIGTLDIGLAGTSTGMVRLEGGASGYVQLQPSAMAGNWSLTLPGNPGSSGYVLSTDGAGVTSWSPVGSLLGGLALSSITSAQATNTIDNAGYGQIWSWNALSSGTAFTISSNSMTTGSLLSLQDTAAASTATGKVLSIADATTGAGFGVYSAMTGLRNTGYAGFFTNTDTGAGGYALYASSSSASGYAGFFQGAGYALAATGTSYFNGNVGIGTAAPAYPLQEASGNDVFGNLRVYATNTSGSGSFGLVNTNGSSQYYFGDDSDVRIYSNTGLTLGRTSQLYLSTTGNVGIGTTAPGMPLTINGSVLTNNNSFYTDCDTANCTGYNNHGLIAISGGIAIQASSANNQAGIEGNGTDFFVKLSGTKDLTVTSTGWVGVGTTSPGSTLEVNGTAQLDSTTTVGGTANFNGGINATGLGTGTVAAGKYLGLNSSNQVVLSSASGGTASNVPLSGITAATGGNTIDSGNNAQMWEWGTLSTQTAMALSTSSMTGGTLLSLQNTAAAATSTGFVLSVTDATTGTGYGIYSAMTATANTGYAIYATNTGDGYALGATGTSFFNGNVGIGTAAPSSNLTIQAASSQGTNPSVQVNNSSGQAILSVGSNNEGWAQLNFFDIGAGGLSIGPTYSGNTISYQNGGHSPFTISSADSSIIFYNDSNPTLTMTEANNVGIGTTSPAGQLDVESPGTYAGYFNNTGTEVNYAVYAASATTTNGYGVYGALTATANSGYAGYFANTATTNTGYALYASNIGGGYALGATGTSAFNGYVGIGTMSPAVPLEVAGGAGMRVTNTTNPGNYLNISAGAQGCCNSIIENSSGVPLDIETDQNTAIELRPANNTVMTVGSGSGGTTVQISPGEGNWVLGSLAALQVNYPYNLQNTGNIYGIQIPAATVQDGSAVIGNAYGLSIAAPTGATNNYAAAFTGGNVGIGTTAPGSVLEVNGTAQLDSTTTVGGALNATATVNMAGGINATGLAGGTVASGKYLGLNSSNQVVLGPAGVGAGIALNSITGATGSNTIDNAGYGQIWSWNSLSSGTAFTISSNSMTIGSLLSLQDTATAATSTGKVLSLSDATTGAGFGVYSAMTGLGNTGYAGFFANTDTGAAGYALYASSSSARGYAGYFQGAGYALAATGTSFFNGYVGIGTAAPDSILNVVGNSPTELYGTIGYNADILEGYSNTTSKSKTFAFTNDYVGNFVGAISSGYYTSTFEVGTNGANDGLDIVYGGSQSGPLLAVEANDLSSVPFY